LVAAAIIPALPLSGGLEVRGLVACGDLSIVAAFGRLEVRGIDLAALDLCFALELRSSSPERFQAA
jgi:hypothetical protein